LAAKSAAAPPASAALANPEPAVEPAPVVGSVVTVSVPPAGVVPWWWS
jgi:hypothetical protein